MIQETATQTELGEQIVTFQLGDSRYSAPAQYVREVQPLRSAEERVTRLPG